LIDLSSNGEHHDKNYWNNYCFCRCRDSHFRSHAAEQLSCTTFNHNQSSASGTESGKGAVYAWEGNSEVGHGRMEIIESTPSSKLLLKIEFIKPFAAINTIEFNLAQTGENTTITQAMYGPSPFVSKLMGLFFSMDKIVGGKYEEGLATLKTIAEK
jgi:hypothetical protein